MAEIALDPVLLVDFILLLMIAEAAILFLRHRKNGSRPAPRLWLPTILSGGALILALRVSLSDGSWFIIVAALAAAGVAHLFDLLRYLRT